jgi:hypothetical protein
LINIEEKLYRLIINNLYILENVFKKLKLPTPMKVLGYKEQHSDFLLQPKRF